MAQPESSCAERKGEFPKILYPVQISFRNDGASKKFSHEKKNKRISSQQIFSIRMTKGSSSKKESDNKQKSGTAGMKKE